MKCIKTISLFLIINSFFGCGYAKINNSWNDPTQEAIQIKSPIDFIDKYGTYSIVSTNKKIRLTDFGDVDKNKNGRKYTLKKFGVQIFNQNKVFDVYKSTVPLKSNVDLNILYRDKNVVAFRVRENFKIDYVKTPFRSVIVNTFVYNFNSNNFLTIPVLASEENNADGNGLDLLQGDQFTFDSKKGIFTYLANIKYAQGGKSSVFKVDLSNTLKCVSATQGCENIGLSTAELSTMNK